VLCKLNDDDNVYFVDLIMLTTDYDKYYDNVGNTRHAALIDSKLPYTSSLGATTSLVSTVQNFEWGASAARR